MGSRGYERHEVKIERGMAMQGQAGWHDRMGGVVARWIRGDSFRPRGFGDTQKKRLGPACSVHRRVPRRLAVPVSSRPRQPRHSTSPTRQYEPFLIAETAVPQAGASAVRASSQGFRTVAKYIFGGNRGAVKMKMTAPVTTAISDRGPARVSFVMQPSEYVSTSQAPRPSDSAVKVKRVDGRLVATRSFSGPPPTDARVAKERALLLKALESAGLANAVIEGETLVSGYHDPFMTPGPLRRNEVAVPLNARAM